MAQPKELACRICFGSINYLVGNADLASVLECMLLDLDI